MESAALPDIAAPQDIHPDLDALAPIEVTPLRPTGEKPNTTASRDAVSQALEREIRAPKYAALFAAACARHPALAPHHSPECVLAVLSDSSPSRNSEKDLVTRALVSEYQTCRHPYWASLLLVAYAPMLARLRGCLRRDGLPDDELQQLVATAFIETLASIRPERRWICLTLRRRTERRLFRHIRLERQQRGLIRPTEPDRLLHRADRAVGSALLGDGLWPATRSASRTGGLEPDEQEACEAFLVEHASHALGADDIALVTATLVHGMRIADYVEHRYPDLEEAEKHRAYQRVKRQHSRAMARLREVFADIWQQQRTGDDAVLLAA